IESKGGDEIGQLMNGFNQMMGEINTLIKEKYEYGQQIKGLELKALQAQINPHFLYNSLDLINCIAIQNEVPEIIVMVNSLAKFYKLSLSRGNDVISLRDEFMHSRLYIQIQNMRFENCIQTKWEIDETLLDFGVIKIILQPIIENAIIHGIFERQDKVGTLWISCIKEDKDIFIRVADNGVGMDAETIRNNFTPGPPGSVTETRGGYGIRNIQDRLRLIYGESYGLSCQSTLGKGTVVTVRIPAVVLEHKIEKEK
ncbi:MAG: sensor histidine kinase, partial [Oscillospiraceae bacterium]